MTPLFKKLNLKEDTSEIVVLNAPETFESALKELAGKIGIAKAIAADKVFRFLMTFVTKQQQVDELSPVIAKGSAEDAVIWFCYPKGSSKKYKCDFNRDNGWAALGKLGFEPVRMIAIDEDWSALRFRKVQHIKKMIRSRALSKEGEVKASIGLTK